MGNCSSTEGMTNTAGANFVSAHKDQKKKDSHLITVREQEQGLRVRESIFEVIKDKRKVDRLMKAWYMMKNRDADDPLSFWKIGGFHGAPFIYRPDIEKIKPDDDYQKYVYWGGYCNHGNVLFPTWHRAYVLAIENALRSYDEDTARVSLPFWDETAMETLENGVPSIFTSETYTFGDGCSKDFSEGDCVPNPLRSFTFPCRVTDKLQTWVDGKATDDDNLYAKPAGYETVRFPLSGLVGTEEARKKTAEHNANFKGVKEQTYALNLNVSTYMSLYARPKPVKVMIEDRKKNGKVDFVSTGYKFIDCLDAPNYTVFSNTTSAGAWAGVTGHDSNTTALEAPHNDVHLAVGGIDLRPQQDEVYGILPGANGDMGENNTAGLDPIFFFHHCFIDQVFWLWQRKHDQRLKSKTTLDVIDGYAGTNSVDSQGPTPFIQPGESLSLDTPLYPFIKNSDGSLDEESTYYSSTDVVDIEGQLGYTYGESSLEPLLRPTDITPQTVTPKTTCLEVSNVSRLKFNGSFMIQLFKNDKLIGFESVLSRGNITNCGNCMKHLHVSARFPLSLDEEDDQDLRIEIVHRGMKEQTPSEEDGEVLRAKLSRGRLTVPSAGLEPKKLPKLTLLKP